MTSVRWKQQLNIADLVVQRRWQEWNQDSNGERVPGKRLVNKHKGSAHATAATD